MKSAVRLRIITELIECSISFGCCAVCADAGVATNSGPSGPATLGPLAGSGPRSPHRRASRERASNTFEDHGTILEVEPGKLLKTTYFSASSGLADKPENYNVVTYELTPSTDDTTKVTVTQTNNPDQDGADRASANWGMTLTSLKELLEK